MLSRFKQLDLPARVALVGTAFVVLAEYFRLFYSLPLHDESFYIVSAILNQLGGRSFFNEMFFQQTCFLLFEPIFAAWHWLFGTSGIMLFARHIFFAVEMITGVVTYGFCRRRLGPLASLCVAAVTVAGIDFGLPTIGYNAMASVGFGCLSMLALRAVDENSTRFSWWSGFIAFLTMASYPTMAVGIFILWMFILVSKARMDRKVWKHFWIANLFGGGLLVAWAGLLVARFDWENIVFSYQYHTAHSSLGKFWPKQLYVLHLASGFAPWWWAILGLFALWFVLWRKKGTSWILFAAPIAFLTATGWKDRPEGGTWGQAIILVTAVAGIALVIDSWRRERAEGWRERVLWGAGLLTAPIIAWTSGMTYYSTHYAALYALTAVLALTARDGRRWATVGMFVIAFAFIYQQHEDSLRSDSRENPANLTRVIEWGPFAGFLTYDAQYEFMKQLQTDLDAVTPGRDSAVFYNSFPAGYLMTTLRPQTRAIHIHGIEQSYAVKPFFRWWYENPLNRPDVVVRFNAHFSSRIGSMWNVHPDQFKPAQDVFWSYLPEESGAYEPFVTRELYSIFVRKK